MSATDVFKQMVVNRVLDSSDLQNIVKCFIFYDTQTAKTRRIKRALNNNLKLGLIYDNIYDVYWTLSYRYEIAINSANCMCCGNYYGQDLRPEKTVCVCNEQYVEDMIRYMHTKQHELTAIHKESNSL